MGDFDKYLELARKLHALAERGIGGEAHNAEALLERLLKKHSITIEELNNERRSRRQFDFKTKEQRQFLLQVVGSVIGKHTSYYVRKGVRGKLSIDLNTVEHIEVLLRYEHYWNLWLEELDLFYNAFIQANKLYAKPGTDRDAPALERTPEEWERLRRMAEMMRGIRTDGPQKRLKAG